MQALKIAVPVALAALLAFSLAGCTSPANHTEKTPKAGEPHDHEHHHHGPHNGHLMELGQEEYHAEWTHDEKTGQVTFYILDAAAEKEVPIAADEITIDVKVGNNPPKTYKLEAVNPTDGKSAAFTITDKGFEGVFDQLKSPGLVLTLHVNINGKQFDQPVKEHEHE
jgi:hypothetical protein